MGNLVPSAFKTILVGDDGTPEAEQAVEVAISLAQSLSAKLILLGVVGPPSAESQAEGYGLETVAQARERLNETLRRKIQASAHSEIEIIAEVFEGKPDEVIGQRVEEDFVRSGCRRPSRYRTGEALAGRFYFREPGPSLPGLCAGCP